MGDIKSTLDLVLEKTRHLKLSQDEKRKQEEEEVGLRIKGLVQKFLDRLLAMGAMETQLDTLKSAHGAAVDRLLAADLLGRIQIGSADERVLALLRGRCGLATEALEKILDDHRHRSAKSAAQRSLALKKQLQRRHGVHGSAVVPHLESDEAWRQAHRAMVQASQEALHAAVETLQASLKQ
jgi:hypothetical protein